jgi:hypothetical protein
MANILAETKRRPYTVVRRVHRAEISATAPNLGLAEKASHADPGIQR